MFRCSDAKIEHGKIATKKTLTVVTAIMLTKWKIVFWTYYYILRYKIKLYARAEIFQTKL